MFCTDQIPENSMPVCSAHRVVKIAVSAGISDPALHSKVRICGAINASPDQYRGALQEIGLARIPVGVTERPDIGPCRLRPAIQLAVPFLRPVPGLVHYLSKTVVYAE